MLRVLVNIRGCNGAGKSTVPMAMMDDPHMTTHGVGRKKNGDPGAPYITVFPSYKWVALGTYFNKTGGMDTIGTNEEMLAAFKYAWKNFPSYDMLMEGIIASTIRSTYIDLFKEYQKLSRREQIDPPRRIIIINFLPPVAVCIRRVLKRNGGKPVKEDQIESKWHTVARNVQHFRDAGLTSIRVDTSKFKRSEMLEKFQTIVEKYRRLDK